MHPTAHGSRCAVRLAREAGGGARHIALGKNPKKSPHVAGLIEPVNRYE